MVIPVRILDDYLHLRIHLSCRFEDEVLSCLSHNLESVLCPAHVSLSSDVIFRFCTCVEEVVENELVKVLCSVLRYLLHLLSVLRVGVAECLETIAFVNGVGDASGCLDAFLLEELLGLVECGVIDNQKVAMRLKVDFVHIKLL